MGKTVCEEKTVQYN